MIGTSKKGLELPMAAVIGGVAAGLGIILLVGLLSGLVARPNNCLQPANPVTVTSTPGTVPPTTTGGQPTTTRTSGGVVTTTPGPVTTTPFVPTTQRTSSTVQPATTSSANTTAYRLPQTVTVTGYDLTLQFDHDPFSATPSPANPSLPSSVTYAGTVTIRFTATAATSRVVLHMDRNVNPTVAIVPIQNTNTNQAHPVTSSAHDNYQMFNINLGAPLVVGNTYSMQIGFTAATTYDTVYWHAYTETLGERSVVGTRFLPVGARTAFPCFDEPGFKAPWTITIEHSDRAIALSNWPVASGPTSIGAGKARTVFQTTAAISPHSVGWSILPNDFGVIGTNANIGGMNVPIYVRARLSEINTGMADYARDIAAPLLQYLATTFNANGALPPKIDLVALPYFPDFSSPSLGLNGFREDDLLWRFNKDSKPDQEATALLIAKELAHIWFGNYVSVKFWDDAWISEGLAQLYQYRAVDSIQPDWDVLDRFLTDNVVPVMWRDGYESAVPLRFEIHESVEIKYLFTDLLYQKSAALMRMFAANYGPTNWNAGLGRFFTQNAQGSVSIAEFATAFTLPTGAPWNAATGLTSRKYFEAWVSQNNYPELVTLINPTNGQVTWIQDRFLLSIIEEETNITTGLEYIWPIYIECVAGGQGSDPLAGTITPFSFVLTGVTAMTTITPGFNWVKCNKDFNGYYVSEYGNPLFQSFEAVLINSPDLFSIGDRVNLIHISFELAWLGTHSYSIPALITVYLESIENAYAPWATYFYHVDRLANLCEHRASFRNLRGHVNLQIIDAVDRIGYNLYEDSVPSHTDELLKLEFANQLGRLQDVFALNNFTALFNGINPLYFVDPNTNPIMLSSNFRAMIYKYHLQNTYNQQDWFNMMSVFEDSNHDREREYALDGVSNTRASWLFDLLLADLLFAVDQKIPVELAPRLVGNIGANPTGRYFAWYYLREYWGDFYLAGIDMRKLSEAMLKTTSSFDNMFLIDEIVQFFLTTFDFDATDTRLRMLETALNNYLWTLDSEANFINFFYEVGK